VETLHSDTALSPQEAQRLRELEATIQEGYDSFLKVGLCFAEVRASRLYRASHDTFESYCRDKWGLSVSRTNQIIASTRVVQNITGAFPADAALIEGVNEPSLRPLSKLSPELQTVTWELIRHIEERPASRTISEVVATIRSAIDLGWQDREPAASETRDSEASRGRTCPQPERWREP
jgi:hypothetical protein